MCVREYLHQIPFGVVESEGSCYVQTIEKPEYKYLVNAGVYCLNPEVLSIIKSSVTLDMPSLINIAKLSNYEVHIFPIHEYWLDIGRPETLQEAHNTWLDITT